MVFPSSANDVKPTSNAIPPRTDLCSISVGKFAHRMDTLNVIASSSDGRCSEDALKVLGRVADAFDNPSLHKADKEVLFVVNVVKSRRLLTSLSSESVCQDTTYGTYESSFDSSNDEEVELVELGDVSVWEHASSYPYTSRRYQSDEPRSLSERVFRKDNGMYDVTKMLLTSSPLDRLDRLARMELKKAGWFERIDKWSVVEMGLQGIPLPITPPKAPSKNTGLHVRESWEHFSPTKPTSLNGGKQTPHSPRRPETIARQSPRSRVGDHDTPERNQRQGDAIRSSTPASIQSPHHSQESGSYLVDFSTLSYADTPRTNTTTPIRASRLSRTALNPQISQQQTRGRLGQVVRNFVKRMLPPSSGGGAFTRSTSYRTRHAGNVKGDSPSARTCQAEMTPRSNASGESAWTFASANSWMEAGGQGCLDYQATNRWSGFWH